MKTAARSSVFLVVVLLSALVHAARGDVLWENYYDGGEGGLEVARSVAVLNGRVFVAGATETSSGGSAFTVRAYSAPTGEVLWQDYYNREGNGSDAAYAITACGNRVFAAGYTESSQGGYAFSVRAYSAWTGKLLWENHYDKKGTGLDAAWAVSASGNRVFAAGTTEDSQGAAALTVRAYSAWTGKLLWEDHFGKAGGSNEANAIALLGNRVFVVGYTRSPQRWEAFTVRAYSAETGDLLWKDHFDAVGPGAAIAVAARNSRVFAAGYTKSPFGGVAFTVRAYSAKTGHLLWEDYYEEAGFWDVAYAITAGNNGVFAAGRLETPEGGHAFMVRAYSASTGRLLWEDYSKKEGYGSDIANAITSRLDQVFAAGYTGTPEGRSAFTVKAYAARTGRLLWEDRRRWEEDGSGTAHAIAARGNRVFAAGYTWNLEGNSAFTVMAYSNR